MTKVQIELSDEEVRAGALSLISSPALLAELAEVMSRPKFQMILARSNTDLTRMLGELRRLVEIADPPPLSEPVSGTLRTMWCLPSRPHGRPI